MAKITRILALLAVMTLVAALPTSVLAQNDAPHLFIDTAVVNGLTAATDTPITAWDGDTQIGSTKVTAGGKFKIFVSRSPGRITFKIDNLDANESHHAWEFGGLETWFTLTADGQRFQGLAAQAMAPLGSNFVRAFAYDNDTKNWFFYDPRAGESNTLNSFVTRQPYFILVTESIGVTLNGRYWNLTCSGGNCWNLIVW